ncbi:Na(+)/H(+) antiporter subunit B [Actinomadura sp. LOL_016]|uniref:Na(+)/H(+) antiporter subunit B n=1 Tax=unclassified Actinomadura TaxID=2626254 RepID=UPI003A7FFEAB
MTPASSTLTATTPAAESALSGTLADVLLISGLALAAFTATAVVLTRDPVRQAIVFSGYGLVLGVLFLIMQAPDVALSQIGVGVVVVPLIVVLALHATRRYRDGGGTGTGDGGEGDGGDARRAVRRTGGDRR